MYVFIIKKITNREKKNIMAKEYRIDGMMCVHCKARVEKELATVAGVTSVVVDLDKKIAIVEGEHSESDIATKVNAIGYEYIGVNK
jgi:copper chaperone CopZ